MPPTDHIPVLPPIENDETSKATGKWLLGGCGAIVVLVILMPAVAILAWNGSHGATVHKRLEKLRAAKQPTTFEELHDFYHVPDGSFDATRFWLDGLAEIQKPEFQSAATMRIAGVRENVTSPSEHCLPSNRHFSKSQSWSIASGPTSKTMAARPIGMSTTYRLCRGDRRRSTPFTE